MLAPFTYPLLNSLTILTKDPRVSKDAETFTKETAKDRWGNDHNQTLDTT